VLEIPRPNAPAHHKRTISALEPIRFGRACAAAVRMDFTGDTLRPEGEEKKSSSRAGDFDKPHKG
jgi:hypothetical protein